MQRKFEILALLLLFIGQQLSAWEMPDAQAYGELSSLPYVYISADGSDSDIQISDSLFNSCAASVHFQVSQTGMNPNEPFLREYVTKVLPLARKSDLVLHKIIIRGAASPEGPFAFNQILGKGRTQELVNFIQQADSTIAQKIESESITEDYSYLLYLMKKAKDPAYKHVQVLFDQAHGDEQTMKTSLMRETYLWKRLIRQYFPYLRSARLMLVFGPPVVKPVAVAEELPAVEPPVAENPVTPVKVQVPPTPAEVSISVDTAWQETEIPLKQYRREWMSVKTNLLFDFAYVPGYDRFCPIPNVAVEFYPLHGHFTYGGSFDCPWWQHYWQHKYFQIRNYQLHSRYYFRTGDVDVRGIGHGAAFKGAYVSAYVHAGRYGICFGEKRGWVGEGLGGGLGVGYVLGLGKQDHWRLEFGAQFGYFYTRYDPYQYECPVDPEEQDHLYYYKWTGAARLFKKRQYRWTWLGPTRAEITLSYDLLYRKNHSRGISFRKTEKGGRR